MWNNYVLQERLRELGFHRLDDGNEFRCGEFILRTQPGAAALMTPASRNEDDGNDLVLGRPGLWKSARLASHHMDSFHITVEPMGHGKFAGDDANESPVERVKAQISWAINTRAGEPPTGWRPLPRESIDALIPDAGLMLQAGPMVRQGLLIHQPNRLALTFKIVEIPAYLSLERRRCLDTLLRDANQRWHLARVGYGDANRSAVCAEVDLTGIPHELTSNFMPIAIDGLRWVVEWLTEPASLVSDANVAPELFEVLALGL